MPSYVVNWTGTATIVADDALAAIEALGLDGMDLNNRTATEITVDGYDFDPDNPPGCSALIFPGTRVDQEAYCEEPVVRWDEFHNPWCSQHYGREDDGEGE